MSANIGRFGGQRIEQAPYLGYHAAVSPAMFQPIAEPSQRKTQNGRYRSYDQITRELVHEIPPL